MSKKDIKRLNSLDSTLLEYEKDEELRGRSLGAVSNLVFATYTEANRMVMANSHQEQRQVLKQTEFPRVFTNYENIVGKYSSYLKTAKGDYEILKRIEKFPEIPTGKSCQPVFYIVKNINTGIYDIWIRKDVENLAEKYGFLYDNTTLDYIDEGDIINEGTVLSHPTSYDKYGNYGFGINAKFMYSTGYRTIEDAICVSERLANKMLSVEVEEVRVALNENEFFINLLGDIEKYQCFPNIGEETHGNLLTVKRRFTENQILFDLKSNNTRRILYNSDEIKYCRGTVIDIDIYCNKPIEDIEKNVFNKQILQYIKMSKNFYEEIKNFTKRLIQKDRKHCSKNILYWHDRATKLTDPDYIVENEDNTRFDNILMYFTIKRDSNIMAGQKLTGRHGNKGIVSCVLQDYLMPHLDNGEQVDIIFNTLGVYNRLNIFQLFEQSITFVTDRIVQYMIENNSSLEEMEKLTFRVIEIFNPEQAREFKNIYETRCKTQHEKMKYFDDVKEYGIFIEIKPFWHSVNVYDALLQCYKEFEFIKKYKVYFYEETSERWVKVLNDQIIGEMYIEKMKQTSKKQLSVCSSAPISQIGVPVKTEYAKKHRASVSRTPVRSGRQEQINHLISIDENVNAKTSLYYRSSPIARKSLLEMILKYYGSNLPIEPVTTKEMKNRNVEHFHVRLLMLGYEAIIEQDELDLNDDDGFTRAHKYKGDIYLATAQEMKEIISKDVANERMKEYQQDAIIIGADKEEEEKFAAELAKSVEEEMKSGGLEWFEENLNYL